MQKVALKTLVKLTPSLSNSSHEHTHTHLIYRDNRKVFMANLLDNHNSVILISNFVFNEQIKTNFILRLRSNPRICKLRIYKIKMFHFFVSSFFLRTLVKCIANRDVVYRVQKNTSGNTSLLFAICAKKRKTLFANTKREKTSPASKANVQNFTSSRLAKNVKELSIACRNRLAGERSETQLQKG